eukprot:2673153-Prymnesium_polylepis.1
MYGNDRMAEEQLVLLRDRDPHDEARRTLPTTADHTSRLTPDRRTRHPIGAARRLAQTPPFLRVLVACAGAARGALLYADRRRARGAHAGPALAHVLLLFALALLVGRAAQELEQRAHRGTRPPPHQAPTPPPHQAPTPPPPSAHATATPSAHAPALARAHGGGIEADGRAAAPLRRARCCPAAAELT